VKTVGEANAPMKASVIVPTLNRSRLLRETLSSIIQQTFQVDQFEVVVVDNGSTDDTRKIVESFIDGHPRHRIRYVYEPEPGLLAGRHRGTHEAVGDLLIFVDDDIEAVPGWLTAIVAGFDDPQVKLVGGRNLPKYEIDPPAWIESFWEPASGGGRYCWYLSLLDLGDEKRRIVPNYIFGLNFAIRRQALIDLGGFHPDRMSGDFEQFGGDGETGLSIAAETHGFVAMYQPTAIVYHATPADRLTEKYFVGRSYAEGISNSYTQARRNGSPSVRLLSRIRRLGDRIIRRLNRSGQTAAVRSDGGSAAAVHKHVADAYNAGFEFHQRAIHADRKVLDWVRKTDYWDYRLPR
jgi:glucosyl-dolichyl phosphate glucuronosyltransferase